MGETPDDMQRNLEPARDRRVGLNQTEEGAGNTIDWRAGFDSNPLAFVGAAFAAALLLGWITGRPASR